MATTMKISADVPRFGPFELKHKRSRQTPVVLPRAVAELKERIRKTRPKYYMFSLADLRKITTPPVQIPLVYRFSSATTTLVGGHPVPLTRLMWLRRQEQRPQTLAVIREGEERSWTRRRT